MIVPEQMHEYIWRFIIPQPYYGPTNVYFIEGPPHTLIDSGHFFAATMFEHVIQSLTKKFGTIEHILCTHPHVDHIGACVALAQKGCLDSIKVAYHGDLSKCENYWTESHTNVHALIQKIWLEVPEYRMEYNQDQVEEFARRCFPTSGNIPFASSQLYSGDIIKAGRLALDIIETPGHNPYHLCFYSREHRVCFSGDLILREGTSLIEAMGDDHQLYLDSLQNINNLAATLVLPAHGRPFDSLEIATKVARRLYYYLENSILRVLDEPRSAYQVTKKILGPHLNSIEYAFIGYARVKSWLDWLTAHHKLSCDFQERQGRQTAFYQRHNEIM